MDGCEAQTREWTSDTWQIARVMHWQPLLLNRNSLTQSVNIPPWSIALSQALLGSGESELRPTLVPALQVPRRGRKGRRKWAKWAGSLGPRGGEGVGVALSEEAPWSCSNGPCGPVDTQVGGQHSTEIGRLGCLPPGDTPSGALSFGGSHRGLHGGPPLGEAQLRPPVLLLWYLEQSPRRGRVCASP